MDSNRFDALTRSLSTAHSRRGVVGAMFGGTLGLLGLTDAEPKRKKRHKKKRRKATPPPVACSFDAQCASGSCIGAFCAE